MPTFSVKVKLYISRLKVIIKLYSQMGPFNVCLFEGGAIAVVPQSWMFQQNGQKKCRWTAVADQVKRSIIPNLNWKVYDVLAVLEQKGEVNN